MVCNMGITRILDSVNGFVAANGNTCYSFAFTEGMADPGNYRVRLFLRYDGVNDLSSATRTGLYAVSDNPCDVISYEEWNGVFRHPFYDTDAARTPGKHDSSFNTSICCSFSGDGLEHTIELFDYKGRAVTTYGESALHGMYQSDNLPVGILLERRYSSVGIKSAVFDPVTYTVTVVTDGPHGYSDGDAIAVSGFPVTDHSCGVNGERFNGTFKVSVVSPDSYTYRTSFFAVGAEPRYSYEDFPGLVSSKWIVCEYIVDRQVYCSYHEALVAWPAHTFQEKDRVTLCQGGEPVVYNAVIESVAPNSFICRSPDIEITSSFDSIIYAPRTPVSDVPANYIVNATPVTTRKRSRNTIDTTSVDNSSTRENNPKTMYPVKFGAFDLDNDAAGSVLHNEIEISARKFGVITFVPPASTDATDTNGFVITLCVNRSTEVATEICMSQLSDSYWDVNSKASDVYAKISKSPIGKVEVKSDPCDGQSEVCPQTCDYGDNGVQFTIDIPSSIGNKWVAAGRPVSLGFTLYGRTGAKVGLRVPILEAAGQEPDDSFKIELTSASDSGDESLIPIKVYPDFLTAGELITIDSLNAKIFNSLAGNTRIRLRDGDPADKWVPVYTMSENEITFFMPDEYNGKVQLTVMTKRSEEEWDAETAKPCSETAQLTAYYAAPKVVKLNERMKPGDSDATISRSASYNRDFAFNGFTEITDENSIIQNLYNCLLTRKGERLFNPDFGTTIEERIFALRAGGNPNDVLKECVSAIEKYEPRIHLVYERCDIRDMGPHGIYLILGVIVPAGEVREITLPFKYRGRKV